MQRKRNILITLTCVLVCAGIAGMYLYHHTAQSVQPAGSWRETLEGTRSFRGDGESDNESADREAEEYETAQRNKAIAIATNADTSTDDIECEVISPTSSTAGYAYVLVKCENIVDTVYIVDTAAQTVVEELPRAVTYKPPFTSDDTILVLELEEGWERSRFRQYTAGDATSVIIEGSEIQHPNTYRPHYEGRSMMNPVRADTETLTVGVYQERVDEQENYLVGTKTLHIGETPYATDGPATP